MISRLTLLALALPLLPCPAFGLDDEDPPLPPGLDVENGDFASGPGSPPENGDSLYHRDAHIGRPQGAGDGCPEGSTAAALSPDKKSLSVLFNNFSATAGGATRSRRSLKLCQLQVPFGVPEGMQVQVVKIDFRGFNRIPAPSSRTRYLMAYYFSDARTGTPLPPAVRRRSLFQGPLEGSFVLSSAIRGPRSPWSGCGRDATLSIRTRIVAASPQLEETLAAIDSLDLVASPLFEYHLRWRPCTH